MVTVIFLLVAGVVGFIFSWLEDRERYKVLNEYNKKRDTLHKDVRDKIDCMLIKLNWIKKDE